MDVSVAFAVAFEFGTAERQLPTVSCGFIFNSWFSWPVLLYSMSHWHLELAGKARL